MASKTGNETKSETKTETSDTSTDTKETKQSQTGGTPSTDAKAEAKDETKTPAAMENKTKGDEGAKSEQKEFKLAAPANSPLTKQDLARIASEAKEQGLNADQAKALVEREHSAVVRFIQSRGSEIDAEQARWKAEKLADPEVGGTDENIKQTEKLLDKFHERFDPTRDFEKLLEETGLIDNKRAVRALRAVGLAMRDDKFTSGSQGGSPTKKDTGTLLFSRVGAAT